MKCENTIYDEYIKLKSKKETIDLNGIVNENHEELGLFASDSVKINGSDENGIHISIY